MRTRFLVLFLGILCLSAAPARSEDSTYARIGPLRLLGDSMGALEIGAGLFNYDNGEDGSSPAGKIEYRFGRKLAFVGPALGVVANTDSGIFGYGGLYGDIAVGPFVFTPLFGVGAYHEGAGKDLGGTLQFRSSLGLFYGTKDGGRFGVSAAHISNGDLHEKNPGENDFFLSYAFLF